MKALAIRENKIHLVGNPELKFEGTPVFLDVEGLPDRDFYYLIGVRLLGNDGSPVQHSLWADRLPDEAKIYATFLDLLKDTKVEVDDWSPKPLQLLLHTNCAAPGIQLRDRVKGTKRTSMAERVFVLPSVIFSTRVSC